MIERPEKDLPWDQAVRRVLSNAGTPLHHSEITQRIITRGLRKSVGATPVDTVAAVLSQSLRNPDQSPYLRVERGVYSLRESSQNQDSTEGAQVDVAPDDSETGVVRAFGMYWQRENVRWTGRPRLLGMQNAGAIEVNFAEQIGVYLLHDRDRTIYVGRATDTIYARLQAHTTGRLGGRWDRFSWFGLRGVDQDGKLLDSALSWSNRIVVETMEALLIESIEPPLNRRRGDNISTAEYLQAVDPELEKVKLMQSIERISKRTEA